MDEYVIRAMAKWPDVPSVHGWLSLDRRGDWRIKGEPLAHRKAVAFINRNYAADDAGRWYFQNGPQRVYVTLEYTPWVFKLDAGGALVTHTWESVDQIDGVYLDDEGSVLLNTPRGIGVIDHRELDALSAFFDLKNGDAAADLIETAVLEVYAGNPSDLVLNWGGRRLDVHPLQKAAVASRFGFDPDPVDGGSSSQRN